MSSHLYHAHSVGGRRIEFFRSVFWDEVRVQVNPEIVIPLQLFPKLLGSYAGFLQEQLKEENNELLAN